VTGRLARLALVLLAWAALVTGCAPSTDAAVPVRTAVGALVDVTGVDLHDGMVTQVGAVTYLYGTEYGCGFTWGQHNTPWCGFGVATSTDLVHWTTPVLLVKPTDTDPWTGTTWQVECGGTGAGCFNPRMIQRTGWGPNDGVWILWFNAPADYNRSFANAYYAMGCNGPAGPCGQNAGPPFGSTHKPSLALCGGNGDLALVPQVGAPPVLLCTNADQTLSEEQLSVWGTDGVGTGATHLAGLGNVESPGAYRDSSGTWILTYSDPNCGYCTGDGTGYATAPTVTGPWTAPAATGVAPPATGRRDLSATSCGGQPRTVSVINGQPYEGIDLWTGSLNEPGAGLHYEPLTYTATGGAPGTVWQPFTPWPCT